MQKSRFLKIKLKHNVPSKQKHKPRRINSFMIIKRKYTVEDKTVLQKSKKVVVAGSEIEF